VLLLAAVNPVIMAKTNIGHHDILQVISANKGISISIKPYLEINNYINLISIGLFHPQTPC
jgi:hypothetical protein